MFRRLSYCTVWLIPIVLTLITDSICRKEHRHRHKRSIKDNFDVLLSLYKINPLKQSKVFREFSNRILVPNTAKELGAMHFDTNESTRERQVRTKVNLKQIEEAIHVTQLKHKQLGRPSFTLNDKVPERFSEELTSKHLTKYNLLNKAKKENDMFESLFGHISSNEILDQEPIINNSDKHPYDADIFSNLHTNSAKNFDIKLSVLDNRDEFDSIKYPDTDVVIMK